MALASDLLEQAYHLARRGAEVACSDRASRSVALAAGEAKLIACGTLYR